MRTALAVLLLSVVAFAQGGMMPGPGVKGYAAATPTLSQTCVANVSGTSVACASGTNFTSGQYVIVWSTATADPATLSLTTSGAGCPASFTNISTHRDVGSINGSLDYGATSAGACTITAHTSSGATGMAIHWWLASSVTGTIDGNGYLAWNSSGAGSITGASCTTTHNGVLIIGGVFEVGNDASLVINSPFATTSPGQKDINLSPQGWSHLAAFYNQSTSGTITDDFTIGAGGFHYSAACAGIY